MNKHEHLSSNYQKEIKKDNKSPANTITLVGHQGIINQIKEEHTAEMEKIIMFLDVKY